MIQLYPHQQDVLEQTKTRVAIKEFEGLYEVDMHGNVYSIITTSSRRKGILKPYKRNGYLSVNLYKNQKVYHKYIHRLVAEAFILNSNEYEEVNHIDCNKTNNCIWNLEWSNRLNNLKHSYDKGLKRSGEKHGMHKLTEQDVINIRKSNKSQKELSAQYKVAQCTISAILRYKLWKEVMPNE